jgi:hypothetical protein
VRSWPAGHGAAAAWDFRRQRRQAQFDGREQRRCNTASTQKVATVLSSPRGRKYRRWWRGRAQLHPEGEDVVLGLAPSERHSDTWLRPTGEVKTLCSAWHRRKGTAALGSGYAAAVRQSSQTMLRRTVVGGGEQLWQSEEWPLGWAKDVLNGRIKPQRRVVLLHLCMVSRWEKGSDVWARTQWENEADRWAPRGSGFSKLKTLPNENSSKQIARSWEKI